MMIELYTEMKNDKSELDETNIKEEYMFKYKRCLKKTLPKDSPFFIIKKLPYI
jgi:hypothetical protein